MQIKTIEDQRKKQLNAIKNIKIGPKTLGVVAYFSKITPEA